MPPRKHRIIGTILSTIVARAPWLWPVIKRPTQKFWNNMAGQWAGRASPDRAAALEAGARALPTTPARILEIGSGTGDGTAALMNVFPDARITGADLSEAMVKAASEAHPTVDYKVADASSLPFEAGSFDLVAQLNCPVYAKEIKRVLAPGGHVLVASTLGPSTPYYTPHSFLRRKFEEVSTGTAERGDFFIGR
jgi:SAM-dependent methyltransferase